MHLVELWLAGLQISTKNWLNCCVAEHLGFCFCWCYLRTSIWLFWLIRVFQKFRYKYQENIFFRYISSAEKEFEDLLGLHYFYDVSEMLAKNSSFPQHHFNGDIYVSKCNYLQYMFRFDGYYMYSFLLVLMLNIALSLLTTFTNIIIIHLIYKNHRALNSPSTSLYVYTAFADLLLGVIGGTIMDILSNTRLL